MPGISFSKMIECTEYLEKTLGSSTEFKEYYKELITNCIKLLRIYLYEAELKKKDISEDNKNILSLSKKKENIVKITKKLFEKIEGIIVTNNLQKYKVTITKGYTQSKFKSVNNCYNYLQNIKIHISNYSELKPFESDVKKLLTEIKDIIGDTNIGMISRKSEVVTVNIIIDKWTLKYSEIKLLVHANFIDKGDYYKGFFLDL